MNLSELLYLLDIKILHLINVDLANPTMDQFWLLITHLERQAWFTFGILPLLLGWLLYIYRWGALKVFCVLGLTVAISDAVAYRGVKSLIDRQRPFQNHAISSWVRKVGDAEGPSFPSNHAANCFAGAMILAFYFKSKRNYFYTFALLVSISRVALGVHYPSDAVGGAILGIVVGFLVRTYILNRNPRLWLGKPVSSSDENLSSWKRRVAPLR